MISNKLFPNERILEVHELSPGYEDHASDVWLVKTMKDEWIVRSSSMQVLPLETSTFR
ncbi:hypothetical protein ACI2JA_02710 [Alkalihalobacillus sp. NPDC078783]